MLTRGRRNRGRRLADWSPSASPTGSASVATASSAGVDNFTGGRHALIPCYVPLPSDLGSEDPTGRSRSVHVPARHVELVQRLGDHPVQTEGIVCARTEAERMRDFVLAEWHRVQRGHS